MYSTKNEAHIILSIYSVCERTGVRIGSSRASDKIDHARECTVSVDRQDDGTLTVLKDPSSHSFTMEYEVDGEEQFVRSFEDVAVAGGFLQGFIRARR
jgi:hypothetical protein